MIHVERLQAYSEQDAIELGLLRPILSPGTSDKPVEEAHLTHIIESPDKDQLVARLEDTRRIVGAATLNIVSGALAGNNGYLMDFVTDPSAGVKGIGTLVWNEMGAWCNEHGVDLRFTSKPTRQAAHNFYHKHGAEETGSTAFVVRFPEQS